MKLISWDTGHRLASIKDQTDALLDRKPDIVALQEVTASTAPKLAELLAGGGLRHVSRSKPGGDSRRRSYCVLIASRHPFDTGISQLPVPWSEKSLSVMLDIGGHPLEFHTVHIPPGASNGWIKVQSLEAVFRGLALKSPHSRVLCGDFNTPQLETLTGQTITWAQHLHPDGRVQMLKRIDGGPGAQWDAAERGVLLGLAEFDLRDVYRRLHGYGDDAYSWVLNRKGSQIRRRFDHIFASQKLNAKTCHYLHAFRDASLSDHSPIEVEFGPL